MVKLVERAYCETCQRFIYEEDYNHIQTNPTHLIVLKYINLDYYNSIVNSGIKTEYWYRDETTALIDLTQTIRDLENANILNYSFNEGNIGLSSNESIFTTLNQILFKGTDSLGTPTEIQAVVSTEAGSGSIEIYDSTNLRSIAQQTFSSTVLPITINLVITGTFPRGAALFDLRLKRNAPPQKKVYCYALNIKL